EFGRPLVARAQHGSLFVLSCLVGLLSPQVVSPDHVEEGLKIYISKAHGLRLRRRNNQNRRIDRNCSNTSAYARRPEWRPLASGFWAGTIHRITNRIQSGVPPIAARLRISIFGVDPLHYSWRRVCLTLAGR